MKSIKINNLVYRQYLLNRALIKSANKRSNALLAKMGLPKAKNATKGEYELINSHNKPIGKLSIFRRPAFQMPVCFISRIS